MSQPPSPPEKEPLFAVDRFFADMAGVALVAMMLITVGSIIGRFLFSMPVPDVEAIAEMLQVAVVFLALAYTQVRGEHVAVTLFTDHLPAPAKRRILIFGHLIGIAAFGILTYALFAGALRAYTTGDAYFGVNQIVTWPARAVAVVGLLAFILRLCIGLIRLWAAR